MRTPRLLATLLLIAACDSTGPSGPLVLVPGGNYTYTAYTSAGLPAVAGTIHLQLAMTTVFAPPQPLGGTWDTHWIPGADTTAVMGPQVGSGSLSGQTDPDGVQLSFEPYLIDFGVVLDGDVRGDEVRGTWTLVDGPRGTVHGRFTLVPAQ